jgi:exopolyphosphatase/guanosine-5'-triphosphate,3'-diphosphate pyrophosphatase
MIIGELRHGQLAVIDRHKETVRLAAGLSKSGDIAPDARARALDCLSRFGQLLRDVKVGRVRAAGTSTIRRAREDSTFMAEAEAALGHPIEVISGIEEARLIYNGVTHSMPPHDGLRLVLDIGGGSTELILGQGNKPQALESLHMGCVSMTERFFAGGKISREGFRKARTAAQLELRPVKAFFRGADGVEAIGTSGTILSTEQVAHDLGAIDSHDLTLAAVEQLIEHVLEYENVEQISLPGLSTSRSQVWPGGLAILAELLRVLRIERLRTSDGALREGLLYDLLGRLHHEDARERTVAAMATRYQVDESQADRVQATAEMLFAQCAADWGFETSLSRQALSWAARLHEIGLDISHDGYQRHGAYIAENADMPGFPRAEQRLLAFLIASQRHDLSRRKSKALPDVWQERALRLAMLLRLSVLLCRNRGNTALPDVTIAAGSKSLSLQFAADWLQQNPLAIADLEREQGYLKRIGYRLTFNPS